MQTANKRILPILIQTKNFIQKMIDMTERDERSMNIMQQNLSAIKFLQKGQRDLMGNYVASCFNNGIIIKGKKGKEKMTKEILKAVNLFNR